MNDEALPTPCLREAAFDLFGAEMPERPVILSVPHAGRDYPDALLAAARVRPGLLRRLEDRWVDLLARPLIARGFSVLVARGAVMSATQLATYDASKKALTITGGLREGPTVHALASFAASLVLTTAICPLDVVLTRFQAGPLLGQPFKTPLQAFGTIVGEGGAVALFRGWGPLWARFLPSSLLTFVIYEQARRFLVGNYMD